MAAVAMDQAQLLKQIREIQADASLSDAEKAQKRQELLSGSWKQPTAPAASEHATVDKAEAKVDRPKAGCNIATIFDESLKCTMCLELCNRPITAPCQHNFCLSCFNKWTAQGKKTCPTCRSALPAKFSSNPRINTALATAIRMAKLGEQLPNANKALERLHDKDRPDEAFTTDRAVRAGRANASSGRIMVTVPGDHFGPIPPEADPRGLGVRVGEFWQDRLDCRQWGAHFPHVAGIAGQSGQGAQSVVLSGGYEDDKDEGEWFLYTGSGGRDLSGNKRVSNVQSFDQTFDKMNKALQVSCQKGLPVRVVRSHKEKRSAYAPSEEQPVRYDGIYRIAACYRKPGNQGKLVCRYLFRRCDNEPAPWASEDTGDQPWTTELPAEAVKEMKQAKGAMHEISRNPWWDWDASKQAWGWARSPPVSQKPAGGAEGDEGAAPKKLKRKASEHERALREFACQLCTRVLHLPLSTPCGHHFCKPCLEKAFSGVSQPERTVVAARTLRVRKEQKPCPSCKADIADFLASAQVNQGMVEVIAKLQEAAERARTAAAKLEADGAEAGAVAEEVTEACEDYEEAADAVQQVAAAAGIAMTGLPLASIAEDTPAPDAKADTESESQAGPLQSGEATAAPASSSQPASKAQQDSEAHLAEVVAEFGEFDAALVRELLHDQGGDVLEVRVYLGKMRRAAAAADRKAKRGVPGATSGVEPKSSQEQKAASPGAQPPEEPVPPSKGRGRGANAKPCASHKLDGAAKAVASSKAASDEGAEDVCGPSGSQDVAAQESAAAEGGQVTDEAAQFVAAQPQSASVADAEAPAAAKVPAKKRGRPAGKGKGSVNNENGITDVPAVARKRTRS